MRRFIPAISLTYLQCRALPKSSVAHLPCEDRGSDHVLLSAGRFLLLSYKNNDTTETRQKASKMFKYIQGICTHTLRKTAVLRCLNGICRWIGVVEAVGSSPVTQTYPD